MVTATSKAAGQCRKHETSPGHLPGDVARVYHRTSPLITENSLGDENMETRRSLWCFASTLGTRTDV